MSVWAKVAAVLHLTQADETAENAPELVRAPVVGAAGDVVQLELRDGEQDRHEEPPERGRGVDVGRDGDELGASSLDPLQVRERAADAAAKAVERPAREAARVAGFDAGHGCAQSRPRLGSSALILVEVPRADRDALVSGPLPDRGALHVGADVAAGAPRLINNTDAAVGYLRASTRAQADVIEYPDSGRISAQGGEWGSPDAVSYMLSTAQQLGYFDGEPE